MCTKHAIFSFFIFIRKLLSAGDIFFSELNTNCADRCKFKGLFLFHIPVREKFDISQSVEKKRYAVKIYCMLYLQHTNNTTQSCQKIWQEIQFLWMCKQSKLDHHELYNSFPLMREIPQGLGVQLCDRLPQSNHEMQQVSFYFIPSLTL